MYNRYIPGDETFAWTRAGEAPEYRSAPGPDRGVSRGQGPLSGLSALWSGGEGRGLPSCSGQSSRRGGTREIFCCS